MGLKTYSTQKRKLVKWRQVARITLTEEWRQENMRNTEKCLKGMWPTVEYKYVIQFLGGEARLKHYLGIQSVFEELLLG